MEPSQIFFSQGIFTDHASNSPLLAFSLLPTSHRISTTSSFQCLPAPRMQASECSRQAQGLSQIQMRLKSRLREATKARFNFFYYHCQSLISGHPDCFAGLWTSDSFHFHFKDLIMLVVSFPILLIIPPISLRQITWLSKYDPWRASPDS